MSDPKNAAADSPPSPEGAEAREAQPRKRRRPSDYLGRRPARPLPSRSLRRLRPPSAQLLANICTTLSRASIENLDAEIERSLQLCGRAIEVEVLSLCVFAAGPGGEEDCALVAQSEWRTCGWMDPPLSIDLSETPWLAEHLAVGREIAADELADLPEPERSVFAARRAQTVAAMPLAGELRPVGYLIAEGQGPPRPWGIERLALLETVADAIGGALQRRAYQRQLIESARRTEETNSRKNEFFALFAHELRAPLTAILGYGEMLDAGLAGPLEAQQQQYLRDLLGGAHHLAALINDGLDLARMESGKLAIDVSDLDPLHLVHRALGQVGPRAQASGVALEVDLPAESRPVRGDPQKLLQIVINLVVNAVKFTAAGGTVTVRVRFREGGYVIEVEDTGVGIAPRDQKRIFERFARVRSGPDGHPLGAEGIGLGLSLVKALVELHAGTISLESAPGAGSLFRVELPDEPPPNMARDAYLQL